MGERGRPVKAAPGMDAVRQRRFLVIDFPPRFPVAHPLDRSGRISPAASSASPLAVVSAASKPKQGSLF
ncbi:MAG: hypothetical protein M0006_02410 [Magnetospirillum sp.]|nr:hypothetical protein [Magnetospirillum sp.]